MTAIDQVRNWAQYHGESDYSVISTLFNLENKIVAKRIEEKNCKQARITDFLK